MENIPVVGSYAKLFSLAAFTPLEKKAIVRVRWAFLLRSLCMNLHKPAFLSQLLALCENDAARMATQIGRAQAVTNAFALLLGPIVSSLSDAVGRPAIAAVRPLGLALHNITLALLAPIATKTGLAPLTVHLIAESLFVGALGAGGSDVLGASMSDLFGSRPVVSSKLQTCDGMSWDVSGLLAPFLGAFIATRSVTAAFVAAAVVGGVTAVIVATMPETLKKDKQKPFSLLQANALANVFLMFKSGVGLRRLAIANTLQQCMYSLHNTIPPYLMGVLQCSISEVSYFNVASAFGMLCCQGFVVGPTLDRLGLFSTYKVGLTGGFAALALQGNSHRGGGGHTRIIVQFLLAQAVEDLVYEMCFHTGRSMVVKQGMAECPEAGLGKLNSSFYGLGALTGSVMPLVWSRLFAMFVSQQHRGGILGLVGPGGHLLVGSGLMAVAWLVLWSTPADKLFLEDEKGKGYAAG